MLPCRTSPKRARVRRLPSLEPAKVAIARARDADLGMVRIREAHADLPPLPPSCWSLRSVASISSAIFLERQQLVRVLELEAQAHDVALKPSLAVAQLALGGPAGTSAATWQGARSRSPRASGAARARRAWCSGRPPPGCAASPGRRTAGACRGAWNVRDQPAVLHRWPWSTLLAAHCVWPDAECLMEIGT